MTRRIWLAPAAAALLAASPLASAPPQDGVYRSRSDVVFIDAAITDGRKPVTTLTAQDFELRDNGVLQSVLDFDFGKLPLDVTMTIDISGSMTKEKRDAVLRAIGQVNAALTPADRAAVHTFGRAVAEDAPLGHPPIAADLTRRGGGTSVFDALLLSLVTAPSPDRRQMTIFMTDADDTSSFFDGAVAVETARHSAGQMSFVILRGGGARADDEVMKAFQAIAATSGGEILRIDSDEQLSETFLKAIENFRLSYVLRYAPAGVPAAGWHNVTLRVKQKNYTVRARRGYWR